MENTFTGRWGGERAFVSCRLRNLARAQAYSALAIPGRPIPGKRLKRNCQRPCKYTGERVLRLLCGLLLRRVVRHPLHRLFVRVTRERVEREVAKAARHWGKEKKKERKAVGDRVGREAMGQEDRIGKKVREGGAG
jgi:hypothetical protein